MIQRLLKKLCIVCCVFLLPLTVFSYDQNTVHKTINEAASRQSKNAAAALKILGFDNGVDSIVNGQRIYMWIQDGGKFEDEPVCRTKFHFHDPLTPSFGDAGLDSNIINTWCQDSNHYSSLIWAQINAVDWPCPDPNSVKPWQINLWSWQNARHYYYGALTDTDTDVREKKFVLTFRALGQVMHLISDISAPSHARDDGHLFGDEFEAWINKNHKKLSYTGIPIDQSIFNQAIYHPLAPAPISALWDINMYEGYNPEVAVGTSIGLAEYSNANFLTRDTMWTYPHPSRADTDYERINWLNPEKVDAEDGKVDQRIYIKKKVGEPVDHIAAVDYWLSEYGVYLPKAFSLDEKCWEDYAQKLIPRAVGYSAGVLDYFFRGKIDVVEDEDVDGYVIKNDSDEDMDGVFELYYDTKTDERKQIQSGDFPLSTAISAKGKSSKITFTPPDDAKEPDKYILVFQGRLGKEDDAVIGNYCTLKFGEEPYVIVVQESLEFDKTTLANVAKGKFYFVFNDKGIDNPQAREALARKMTIKVASPVSYFNVNGHSMPLIDGYYQWRGPVDGWETTGEPTTWEIKSLVGSRDIVINYTKAEWPQASFGIAYIWNWGHTAGEAERTGTYPGGGPGWGIQVQCSSHCCGVKAVDWVDCGATEEVSGYKYWGEVARLSAWELFFTRKYLAQSEYYLAFQVYRDLESQAWNLLDTYSYSAWKRREMYDLNCYAPTPPYVHIQDWYYGCTGQLYHGCVIDWWHWSTFRINWAYSGGCASGGTGKYGWDKSQLTVSQKSSLYAQYVRYDNRHTVVEVSKSLTGGDFSECGQYIAPTAQCYVDVYKKIGGVCEFQQHVNPTGLTPECYPYPLSVDFVPSYKSEGANITQSTKAYKSPNQLVKFEMNSAWDVTKWLNTNKFNLSVIPETIIDITGYASTPDAF